MTGQALINHITMICKKHNIEPKVLKIRFEGKDFDRIPEFDKETNVMTYSHLNYLKEDIVSHHQEPEREQIDIDKACEAYCKVCFNKTTDCKEFCNDVNIFRKAMEQ